MGSDARQCQNYDGNRELGGHQVQDDLVMLVLLWEEELHYGGGVSTLGMKVDADSSKLTVERRRLRKNQKAVYNCDLARPAGLDIQSVALKGPRATAW